MRFLEAHGLLGQQCCGRAAIRLPSVNECRDLYLVRAQLEALAAELAARGMSRPHLEDLRAVQDLFRKATAVFETVPETDAERRAAIFEDINTANDTFHETIIDAASCPPLSYVWHEIHRRMPREIS